MKTSHWMWSGIVAALMLSASAAFAANPATLSFTSTNPGAFFQATRSIWFVNGNLLATQPQSDAANATVQIGAPFFGRNTSAYDATAQVRCNGSPTIFVKAFSGPTQQGTIICNGVGNAWAGTIYIR